MDTRKARTVAKDLSAQSDHGLTANTSKNGQYHPTGGAVSPVHGTIAPPIVVVGATGTIGRAIVRALVKHGNPVVAVAPQADKLGRLTQDVAPDTITPVVGRIDTEADAARLAERLRDLARPIAGAVIAFPHGRSAEPGLDRGRLLDQSTAELAECLQQTLLAQHALARHLIPLLADAGRNARYVIVGGPGSESPWAGYGHRSIATAATRMLARVLHDEVHASGVRVQLVSIDSPVRNERPGEHECPEWPTASDVARSVVHLLDSRAGEATTDAVVSGTRTDGSCSIGRSLRAFPSVPSFLASLRNSTNKISPQ